jgi:enoyl-CoA hydratase/carnithine racemase
MTAPPNHEAATPTAAEPLLLRTTDQGVARLTLNRPRQFNAISGGMLDALQEALDDIAGDPSVRAVVIAGNGSAFSGGHDLKEMMAHRNEGFIGGLFARCSRMMLSLQALPQPVVARVHGIATAAGCQLVAACDLAVASTDACFATSGINLGLFCATPAVPLSRSISRKRAFEMLFTGAVIDAETAREWGLVNRVVPPGELDAEIARLVGTIIEKPPAVIAAGKALFYRQIEAQLTDAYAAANKAITANMLDPDAAEGVSAFVERRKPRWGS